MRVSHHTYRRVAPGRAGTLQEDYKFYGVFDGHCGTRAAKFASRALHLNLELFLNAQESNELARPYRHASIERAVRDAFRKTQRDFLDLLQVSGGSAGHTPSGSTTAHGTAGHRPEASATEPAHAADYTDDVRRKNAANSSPAVSAVTDSGAGGEAGATVPGATAATAAATADDDSGTTATVALVYPDVTVVAHVGDSRAVMCCDDSGLAVEITEGLLAVWCVTSFGTAAFSRACSRQRLQLSLQSSAAR